MCYLIVIPLLALFAVFPELILRIYTDEQSLIDGSVASLRVMLSSYLISVPAFIRFNVVSGTGNTRSALMLEGEGVRSMTALFLQMWSILCQPEFEQFLSDPIPAAANAKGFVVPYGDCPLDGERVGEMVYMDMLNRARKYVHIITPYLILDGELETALRFAAERGVDVHLILPGKPDKWFVYALAKTHYKALISSGVKISEWQPGFTHAKIVIADGVEAVAGTINLDYRSLYHHFENAVWMRGTDCIANMEADFQDTLTRCRRVEQTKESIWQGKKLLHLAGILLKFIAPLV